jgi:nicotinamidase/pyrazinamidase
MAKKVLLIVDVQSDFLSGGNLAVPGGDEIISLVNKLQEKFELVIATKDWHPKNHKSFASQHRNKQAGDVIILNKQKQILWPDHCVKNSFGSGFPSTLNTGKLDRIFYKGTDKNIDSYSGFLDNDKKKKTGLEEYLKQKRVQDIYIAGLATDYCVKFTALDGKTAGFNVFVIADACRGVDLNKGDVEKVFKEMEDKRVNIIKSKDIENL